MNWINKLYLNLPNGFRIALRDNVTRLFNQIPRWDCQMLEALLRIQYSTQAGTEFHGEYLQDLAAYMFFRGKKEGFYVDIGANDGVDGSNSLVFERLGWNGFCVEPHPEVYQTLKINRQCDAYEVALTDREGETIEFAMFDGSNTQSKYSGTDINGVKARSGRLRYKQIQVKTSTFNTLMGHYPGINYIDFISIDVEGGELSVLKTIDFTRYSFGLMMIEDNSGGLVSFMKNNGYRVLGKIVRDYMFVKDDK
jgi:FkbM family methyltransferase